MKLLPVVMGASTLHTKAPDLLLTMSLERRREASLTFLRMSRRDFMTSGARMRASIVS